MTGISDQINPSQILIIHVCVLSKHSYLIEMAEKSGQTQDSQAPVKDQAEALTYQIISNLELIYRGHKQVCKVNATVDVKDISTEKDTKKKLKRLSFNVYDIGFQRGRLLFAEPKHDAHKRSLFCCVSSNRASRKNPKKNKSPIIPYIGYYQAAQKIIISEYPPDNPGLHYAKGYPIKDAATIQDTDGTELSENVAMQFGIGQMLTAPAQLLQAGLSQSRTAQQQHIGQNKVSPFYYEPNYFLLELSSLDEDDIHYWSQPVGLQVVYWTGNAPEYFIIELEQHLALHPLNEDLLADLFDLGCCTSIDKALQLTTNSLCESMTHLIHRSRIRIPANRQGIAPQRLSWVAPPGPEQDERPFLSIQFDLSGIAQAGRSVLSAEDSTDPSCYKASEVLIEGEEDGNDADSPASEQ